MKDTSMVQPASDMSPDVRAENCIQKIADGSTEALSELYAMTRTSVFGLALSIVKSRADADDVTQETFVHIWQKAVGYEPEGKPLAWIYTITRNTALMSLRREGRIVPVTPEDWQAMFTDREEMDTADKMILFDVMSALEQDEREIVMLHAVAGLKHREIADWMGMGLSTVLSKYSRALKKLRRMLEEV